jgi:hypothetical protein
MVDVDRTDEVPNRHLILAGKSERKLPLRKIPSRWKKNNTVNRTARLEVADSRQVTQYRKLVGPF